MSSLESMNQGLTGKEKALYDMCLERNPGLSEKDFMDLREMALSSHSAGIKNFFSLGGVIMEEKPEVEEIVELKDNHLQE